MYKEGGVWENLVYREGGREHGIAWFVGREGVENLVNREERGMRELGL